MSGTYDARMFAWRDHWAKIVVAAPVLSAAVSLSVSEAQYRLLGGSTGPISDWLVVAVILTNAVVATAGSALGGLMIAGTTRKRIAVAFASGLFGLFGYVALGEALPWVVGWLTP
ncbi:MAG: hypothetical protein WBC44_17020 [Planctomycetaceae bacterium]